MMVDGTTCAAATGSTTAVSLCHHLFVQFFFHTTSLVSLWWQGISGFWMTQWWLLQVCKVAKSPEDVSSLEQSRPSLAGSPQTAQSWHLCLQEVHKHGSTVRSNTIPTSTVYLSSPSAPLPPASSLHQSDLIDFLEEMLFTDRLFFSRTV